MTYTAERYQPVGAAHADGVARRPYFDFNSRLNVGIPDMTPTQLLVRDKEYARPDHHMHTLLSMAVETATDDFRTAMVEDPTLSTEIQSPVETEEHAMYFAQSVIESIEALDSDDPSDQRPITVASMATGGFAPTQIIMDMMGGHPLRDRVQFVAIDHTHNDQLESTMPLAKGTVIVDDGLTTGISVIRQAVLPYLEGNPQIRGEVEHLLARMKSLSDEAGTCNDTRLLSEYGLLLDYLEGKGVVLAPMYSRNRVLPVAFQDITTGRDSGWARAQRIITNESAVVPVDEGVEVVGAAIGGLPCRDLGTKVRELVELGLHPDIAEELTETGLDHVEARHLARLEGLHMLSEDGIRVAREQLVDRMNQLMRFLIRPTVAQAA